MEPVDDLRPTQPRRSASMPSSSVSSSHGYGAWMLLLAIGLIAVIFLILASTKPRMVQQVDKNGKPTGELSLVRTAIYSVVLGVIIGVVFWVLAKCR